MYSRPFAIALTAIVAAILTAVIGTPLAAADHPVASSDERAREIGLQASQALQQQLGSALMLALQENGPAAAVAVCADTAQVLTARIARELDLPGLELKRTSLQLRNPANRPDSLETVVLETYAAALAAGEPTEPRLERLDGHYRYFTPIVTRGLCLQCHGPGDGLAEGVPAILAERYPQDGATGHVKGDLRGVVSVTIPVGTE